MFLVILAYGFDDDDISVLVTVTISMTVTVTVSVIVTVTVIVTVLVTVIETVTGRSLLPIGASFRLELVNQGVGASF
jgi:hypothetical protein